MRGPPHVEAEECWLGMVLRCVRNVSESPSELRALRWQAMETSAATVSRQPRKGKFGGRHDDDCIRFIEAVPRMFSHKVEGDDEGKLHVGHVGRWLRAHGHQELAGRLRKATRIRNSSAHPVDMNQLYDDLVEVASGEDPPGTTADGGKRLGQAGTQSAVHSPATSCFEDCSGPDSDSQSKNDEERPCQTRTSPAGSQGRRAG